jgi:lipopolysaccharide export system protein LptA
MRVLALVAALSAPACTGRADPPPSDRVAGAAEGLSLQAPGLALRIGRVSFGGLGLEALAGLASSARAEPAPAAGGESLELEADELELAGDGPARTSVLTGHVLLRRGPLELRCARLETRGDAQGAIVEARATGEVRIARAGLRAEAAAARVDLVRGEIVLEGPVRIVQGEAVLEGARALVSLRDGRVQVHRARGRIRLGPPS